CMVCPVIYGLTFACRSRQVIDRRRDISEISSLLAEFLGYGTSANIFLGNGFIESSYNITSQDWTLFAQAMRGIPEIARDRIELEASLQALDHFNSPDEKKFWEAVANGCSF